MTNEMSRFKATADAHMRRDLESAGTWICTCEACSGIRSLEGVDKLLAVRPLIREIVETEDRLELLPEGQEKQGVVELYHNLHDKLADEMSK
jgi:hypothetical protein